MGIYKETTKWKIDQNKGITLVAIPIIWVILIK